MQKNKKVLIFDFWAYYSPHLEVMAAIARREAAAGSDVKYYACDGGLRACEVDPWGTKFACVNCRHRMAWAGKTAGVNQTTISLPRAIDYSIDYSQLQSLKHYHYRGVNIGVGCASSYISRTRDQDVILNRVTRPILTRQLISAKMIVDAMHKIIDQDSPDVVYLFNGRGFINRSIIQVCDDRNVNYVTVEVGANDERVEEYQNSLPHSIRARTRMMQELWQSSKRDEKIILARTFYEKKRAGMVTNDKSFVTRQKKGFLPKLPSNKTIIAIFNSSDDEIKSIGDEWSFSAGFNQYDVVEQLLNETSDSDLFFIVRMHPNLANVDAPWARKWGRIKKYKNCLFIDAKSKISSYELVDAAERVVVFGSTIGAEAVAAGKPTILYGNAYYENLNICYRAKTIEELARLCLTKLKPLDSEGALIYAYFLMRSGSHLDGYTGNKKSNLYTLFNRSAPVSQTYGWRGMSWFLYAINWLMNRIVELKIKVSIFQ